MSEGPEVKIIADELSAVLLGREIVGAYGKGIKAEIKSDLVGTKVNNIETFGKNIVISFSSKMFLRNHMMMWGKWRIYERTLFDQGLAHPPPRSRWYRKGKADKDRRTKSSIVDVENQVDVRKDSRIRLVLLTASHAAVQFNGPVIQFLHKHPSSASPIALLGPDPLNNKKKYDKNLVVKRLEERQEKLVSDLLLDQTFVAGVGNKYKSEILFQVKLCPFIRASELSRSKKVRLTNQIYKTLLFGYHNNGRTKSAQSKGEEKDKWTARYWVFRRAGRLCWTCGISNIQMDRKRTRRVTYWCPNCQSCT
jgi:endonuclease VIII